MGDRGHTKNLLEDIKLFPLMKADREITTYAYVDPTGKEVFMSPFVEVLGLFFDGLAKGKISYRESKGGTWRYIDERGNVVIDASAQSRKEEHINATDSKTETFDKFLKRFTSDVNFQWSRIKFPLGTLDLGGAENLSYTKDCWGLRMGEEAFRVGHTEENDGESVWDAKFVTEGDDKIIYTDEYSGIWYSKDTFTFERIGGQWYVTAHEIVFPTMLTVDEFKQNVKENNNKYVK